MSSDDYDALVLPGGVANLDILRGVPGTVSFVKGFFEQEEPVGAIRDAPRTLIEADVLRGWTLASCPSRQTDIRNAGVTWVDEEVHTAEDSSPAAIPMTYPRSATR